MKILLVLTSHEQLGNTGEKTGFWLEELAAPYYAFIDAGAQLTLASPNGGQPPLDPKSNEPDFQTDATRRFEIDSVATHALANTLKLSDLNGAEFDAVFYPGGHGPLWDLAEDAASIALIERSIAAGKPVAAVCHAPAVLRHVKGSDGQPLVAGKAVTGFSNSEEGGCRPDPGGAVPGRGHAQGSGRPLQQDRRLAGTCHHRRAADHGPEPGLLRSHRPRAAQRAELRRPDVRLRGFHPRAHHRRC